MKIGYLSYGEMNVYRLVFLINSQDHSIQIQPLMNRR